MKLRTLALLFACTLATPALAQKTAAEVTDAQVAQYKAGAQKACEDGGRKNGDPEERVLAFCTCMIDVMNKTLSPQDWQQVVVYSRSKRLDDERKVIEPALKQLGVCRPEPVAPAAAAPAPGSGGTGLSTGRSGTGLGAPGKSSQGLR